jgi:hypothetical protein
VVSPNVCRIFDLVVEDGRTRDELLAKLRRLTNLRAVADPDSSSGYTVEPGPFPGWAEVPKW